MSDPQNTDDADRDMEHLFSQPPEPPKLQPEARERILNTLLAAQAADAPKPAAGTRQAWHRPRVRWLWAGVVPAAAVLLAGLTLALYYRTRPEPVEDLKNKVAAEGSSNVGLNTMTVEELNKLYQQVAEKEAKAGFASNGSRQLMYAQTAAGGLAAEDALYAYDWDNEAVDELVIVAGRSPQGPLIAGPPETGAEPGSFGAAPPALRGQFTRTKHLRRPAGKPGRASDANPAEEADQGPDGGQGSLLAKDSAGRTLGEFPLKHTDVAAQVAGFLATTRVTQTFGNPYRDPIEAVYVFPLPETAAVHDFLMVVGPRRIRGMIRPREEAERIYAQARARGQTASLLTQERPNIFTQNVANIEPQGEVKIEVTYFHTLKHEKGWYEYTFPMVVGPRYIPGQAMAPAEGAVPEQASVGVGGGGTSPDTDRVPDASHITPPVLRPDQRSGHDIGLAVELRTGMAIEEIATPTHEVKVLHHGPGAATVKLSARDSIPNRDFVLRYRLAGTAPKVGLLAHRSASPGGDHGGFFAAMLLPQLDPVDADVSPREITFLIDISGSQQGVPLDMSKEIVRRCLDGMRPLDRFNVMYFASGNGQLWAEPRAVTPENIAEAKSFVANLQGGGGTEMLTGLARALHAKRNPAYLGMVVFFTDGYVGEEKEILRLAKEERGDTRVFCFGTGSSVNRFLVEGIAEHGGGTAFYALPRDQEFASKAVEHFFEAIDAPVLVDVKLDFGDLPVTDVYPAQVQDLFAGRPITLVGRYTRAGQGTLTVTGRVGARAVRIPLAVSLPEREEANEALAPVWARNRIAELSNDQLTADAEGQARLKQEITEVALEFRLVSAYTSFVAVDESRIVGDGKPLRVLVPVELPEGVSREGAVGTEPVGQAVSVQAWGLVLTEGADGNVVVLQAEPAGVAAGHGVQAGEVLASCDRVQLTGLRHLESLLLQSGGQVLLGFRPAATPEATPVEYLFPAP